MEEMSPAVALPLRVGNSLCDSHPMEITRINLIADAASLLSDGPMVVTEEEALGGAAPACKDAEVVAVEDGGGEGEDLEVRTLPGSDGEDAVSVGPKPSVGSFCLSVSDHGSLASAVEDLSPLDELGAPSSADAVNSLGSVVGIVAAPVDLDATLAAADSNIKIPLIVEGIIQGSYAGGSRDRSVFLLDYVPLWGCVSICGQRPEMEDAVVTVPHFCKIPLWMLTGDRVIDGINLDLVSLPVHFFGVYDGHGGAQVRHSGCTFVLI